MLTAVYTHLAQRVREVLEPPIRSVAARIRHGGRVHASARALIGARVDMQFRLPRGGMVSFDHPADLEIRCHSGVLWVTQEMDLRDYVLGPGDAFYPGARGPVLAVALEGCCSFAALPPERQRWRMDRAAPSGPSR
jgi:hypothetical protein